MATPRTKSERAEADDELYQEFRSLATLWKEETAGYAFLSKAIQHPAYEEIIAMGEQTIPWMLRDLADGHGQWFHALRLLTGASPIADEDRGYRPKMRSAWLEWGREQGWIE